MGRSSMGRSSKSLSSAAPSSVTPSSTDDWSVTPSSMDDWSAYLALSSSSLIVKAASRPGPHLHHSCLYHAQPGYLLACRSYEDQEGPERTHSREVCDDNASIASRRGHYLATDASVASRLQAIAAAATTLRESTP